jgi:hypothetical protein
MHSPVSLSNIKYFLEKWPVLPAGLWGYENSQGNLFQSVDFISLAF